MKNKIILLLVFTFLFSCLATSLSWSHSGRTDSSGGHYNRKTGEYHYHGGKAAPPPTYTPPPKPSESYQETQKVEGTVYVTNSGKKYHSSGCRYLRKSQRAIDIKKARSSGYTACKVCGGIPDGSTE